MTATEKNTVAELISDLKQQRDELRLKIHLGNEEIKEEWDRLDSKLSQLNHRFDPLREAVEDTTEDLWESLKLVGAEIKKGFNRIRKAL